MSGLSQAPITECTASPIGLTRRSHGSGISDELKVITCDKPLSGRMCNVLVEGGGGRVTHPGDVLDPKQTGDDIFVC